MIKLNHIKVTNIHEKLEHTDSYSVLT